MNTLNIIADDITRTLCSGMLAATETVKVITIATGDFANELNKILN